MITILAIEAAAARRALEGAVERVAAAIHDAGCWGPDDEWVCIVNESVKDSARLAARRILGLDPEPRP